MNYSLLFVVPTTEIHKIIADFVDTNGENISSFISNIPPQEIARMDELIARQKPKKEIEKEKVPGEILEGKKDESPEKNIDPEKTNGRKKLDPKIQVSISRKILAFVKKNQPCTLKEIADHLGIFPSQLSPSTYLSSNNGAAFSLLFEREEIEKVDGKIVVAKADDSDDEEKSMF